MRGWVVDLVLLIGSNKALGGNSNVEGWLSGLDFDYRIASVYLLPGDGIEEAEVDYANLISDNCCHFDHKLSAYSYSRHDRIGFCFVRGITETIPQASYCRRCRNAWL